MSRYSLLSFFFFFNDTATTEIYTLSLHDALPIFPGSATKEGTDRYRNRFEGKIPSGHFHQSQGRSEEHTSELQSQSNLVCRLLLEKKKKKNQNRSRLYILYSTHI